MEFEDVFVKGKVGKSKKMEDIIEHNGCKHVARKTMKVFSEHQSNYKELNFKDDNMKQQIKQVLQVKVQEKKELVQPQMEKLNQLVLDAELLVQQGNQSISKLNDLKMELQRKNLLPKTYRVKLRETFASSSNSPKRRDGQEEGKLPYILKSVRSPSFTKKKIEQILQKTRRFTVNEL